MKGTFISNFLTEAKGKAITVVKAKLNSTNILSSLSEGGNKLKSVLSVRVSAYDNLINGFLQNADLVSDKWAETACFCADDYANYQTYIDQETADNLVDVIREFGQIGGALGVPSDKSMILYDGNGYSYLLDTTEKYFGSKHVLISNTMGPVTDVRQAVMYIDDQGRIVFNNVMFSQYWSFQPETPLTILDKVVMMVQKRGAEPKSTIRENLWALCEIEGLSPAADDITSYLAALTSRFGVAGTGVIDTDVSALYEVIVPETPEFTKYAVNSIWDIISDNIATNEINSMFSKTLDAVGGSHTVSNITAVIQDALDSKYQSVKETAKRVVEAYNSGGFAGVIAFIAGYLDKGCSVSNDDGQLVFTDNEALVPRQYIATMVSTVATSIASVAGMLLSVISLPLGMAVSALAGIAKGVLNSITYDYSSTRPALFDSDDVAFNVAPYGMFQKEFPAIYLGKPILDLLENQMNIICLETVGGCVFVGAGTFNADGSIKTARWEFHPSLDPHFDALHEVQRRFISPFIPLIVETEIVPSSTPNIDMWHWRLKNLPPSLLISPNLLMEVYDQYRDESLATPLSNQSDGYLSNSDSALLNNIIVVNIALFALYFACMTGSLPYSDDTALYADDCWIFGNGDHVLGAQTKFRNILNYGLFVDYTLVWVRSDETVVRKTIPRLTASGGGQGWKNLSDNVASHMSGDDFGPSDATGFVRFFQSTSWYDYPSAVPSSFQYGLKLPQYDASTFLLWIVAAAVVTAAVAVTTAVLTVKAKRAINKKRAQNNARVEQAWSNFAENPTADNYASYRKTVKKNNLWVKFIGGTKYDTNNYWNGDIREGSPSADTPSVSKFASSLGNSSDESNASSTILTDLATANQKGVEILADLSLLQRDLVDIIRSTSLSTDQKVDAIRTLIIGPETSV